MYIHRNLEETLLNYINFFPAIAVLGPRQVGKTTLVKAIREKLPRESIYLDLENPADTSVFVHPMEFFNSVNNKVVIIDEVQRNPELFPILRSAIDINRENGRFILLGSASKELLHLSNETLAGRIVYTELTPFVYNEINKIVSFREHWLYGGFPVAFGIKDNRMRREWLRSFLSGYIERDLKALGLSTSSNEVQRLLYMLASMQGGLLNISSLSNSLGVSGPTAKNILSFFERSFILRMLQPWYANIGKRLVKSPKIYLRDSGIVNHLLDISSYESMLKHPLLGNLWEGYVIENIINTLGVQYQYYFYRTADGTECDLLIFKGTSCKAAIDIKFSPMATKTKSMTLTMQDLKPEKAFFVIPEFHTPYQIEENLWVTDMANILHDLHL